MHQAARNFLDYVYNQLPGFFKDKRVLDVGSGDINGNNRHYFSNCTYTGNDVVEAPNVTVVAKTSDLNFPDGTFDTVVSSECFEHDMYYEDSLRNIVRMLKPGGLFAFTCASTGRPEHGTRRTTRDSYTLRLNDTQWNDYYRNLTHDDVCAVVDCDKTFSYYAYYYNRQAKDLYFVGVKSGGDAVVVEPYVETNVAVTRTSVSAT